MATLPVISAAGRSGLCARAVREALEEFGFFFVADHGCDVEGARASAAAFYAQSLEERQRLQAQDMRGWTALGTEITQGQRDWHECFDMMQDRPEGATFAGANRWPEEARGGVLDGFEGRVRDYAASCERLSSEIVRAVCTAYGFAAEEAEVVTRDPFHILRMLRYPPFPTGPVDSDVGIGIGAHTDYGFVTLLTTTAPGLEVWCKGAWAPVPPHPTHLLCNIGDAFSEWTRQAVPATPHRVGRVAEERTSVAYFFEPNLDVVVRPLGAAQDGAASPRRCTHGEYLAGKYHASYPTPTDG